MIKKNIKNLTVHILLFLFSAHSAFANTAGGSGNIRIQIKSPAQVGSVQEMITLIVDWIINLGVVAVTLAFIYVGFQFVAARGNPDALQKTRQAFMWTVIGTLVLVGAKVLTEVIKNTLTSGGVITN